MALCFRQHLYEVRPDNSQSVWQDCLLTPSRLMDRKKCLPTSYICLMCLQTACIVSNNHQSGLSPATIFSEVSPNIIWILNLKLKTVCLLTHSVASPDNIFIECVLRQVCLVCLLTLCVCIVSQQHLSRVSFHTIWSVALELQMECLLTPSVWSPVCARPPR